MTISYYYCFLSSGYLPESDTRGGISYILIGTTIELTSTLVIEHPPLSLITEASVIKQIL